MNRRSFLAGALALPAYASLTLAPGCGAGSTVQSFHDAIRGAGRGFVHYIDPGHFGAISVNEIKGEFNVELLLSMNGLNATAVPDGGKILVRTSTELLTFANHGNSAPIHGANPAIVFTQWKLNFPIDRPTAERFAREPLIAVEIDVGTPWQMRFDADDAEVIQRNMKVLTGAAAT